MQQDQRIEMAREETTELWSITRDKMKEQVAMRTQWRRQLNQRFEWVADSLRATSGEKIYWKKVIGQYFL